MSKQTHAPSPFGLHPSLRMKFLSGLVATAIIPLLILGLLQNYTMQNAIIDNVNRKLSTTSQRIVDDTDNFITGRIDFIRVVAQLPPIEDAFQADIDQTKRYEQASQALSALSRESPLYLRSYILLDKDGIVIADTVSEAIGANFSSADYFREPLHTGLPYASPVKFIPGISSEESLIVFSSPVRNKLREISGVVVVYYRTSVFQSILNTHSNSEDGDTFSVIFDEHLMRIATVNPSQPLFTTVVPLDPAIIKQLQNEQRLPALTSNTPQSNDPALAMVLQSTSDRNTFTLSPYQAARTPLKHRPWQVVTFQQQDLAFRPLHEQRRSAILVGLGVLSLVIVAALLAATKFAQPILQLTRVMKQVATGDLTAQVTLSSRDEIGQLAQGFNSMIQQLRTTQEGLEHLVTQRTAQLSQSLAAQEEQADALRESLQQQQQLNEVVLQLSVPVIPAIERTLVIPLIGNFYEERGSVIAQHILQQIERFGAHTIILDLTGVTFLTTEAAHRLIDVAHASALLGAHAILVGVRPEIAQTMVSLGVDLGVFEHMSTLQEALAQIWKTRSAPSTTA